MATIIGVTGMKLTVQQQKSLCAEVPKAVCDAFHLDINISSMMLLPSLPDECCGPAAENQITYFIYTAPDKPLDQKRNLVKNVYEVTKAIIASPREKGQVVIIFKEHADNNVGVDGVLRIDAKKNGTFKV